MTKTKHKPGAMKAKLERLSICPCGFSLMADHIPLGKEYLVHPELRKECVLVCGGCGKEQRVTAIYVEGDASNPGGYMPLPVFITDEELSLKLAAWN